MTFSRILYTFILSIIIAPATFGAIPMRNSHVSALSPYCFPGNSAPTVSYTFGADGTTYIERSDDGKRLISYEVSSGKEIETILDLDHTRETSLSSFSGFTQSPNGAKILIWQNEEPIYRRSFYAQYYVYDIRTRILRPLSTEHPKQRDPLFSPDARMVAFVADNNIHIAKLDYKTEVAVTTDGAVNDIINGVTDWVYEEEFGRTCAMTWAPDNLTLCFEKFNESQVPLYSLPIYEGTCDRQEQYALYPGEMSYKYPVAGMQNSVVTIHSYDVETRKTKQIELPKGDYEYIPRIVYTPSETRLLITTLNRDQNHFEIFSCNPKSTVTKTIYTDISKGWIDESAYNDLLPGANSFIVASSQTGYTHYFEYSYTGSLIADLTPGEADATAYYGFDASGNHYFQSASPTPMERTIYLRDKKGVVKAISRTDGTSSAQYAPGCGNMLLTFSNITTPPTTNLCRADGKNLRTVADNKAYADKARTLKAEKEFFTLTSDGIVLNGYIIKPRNFDAGKRYPVIMNQYSGPGSQQVLNRWNIDWEDYAATQGYVVICVDGRGTGGRGTDFRFAVYRNLGHFETIDQVNAAKYAASLSFVDPSKIGIYGWSYGGYEALMCASVDDSPYASAVAIAPVTDWRYYDSVYTERFMLTPSQNESGYNSSSAIARASHLSCPLLIMYGTADDNVHPANSLQYISTLQSFGILADMFVFPNKNHSIYGCNARAVVYARMMQFFDSTLK